MRRLALQGLFALLLVAAGCGRPETPAGEKPAESPAPAKTVTRQLVEEVTGYRAVQQGRQVQEKLRQIGDAHEKDMEAILNDKEP